MFTKGALWKFNRQSTINVFCNATSNYRLPETWCHNSHCWLPATIQNDAIPFSLQTKKQNLKVHWVSKHRKIPRPASESFAKNWSAWPSSTASGMQPNKRFFFLDKKQARFPERFALESKQKWTIGNFHVPTQCRTFWNNDPIKNPCFQTIMPLSSYSTAPVLVL